MTLPQKPFGEISKPGWLSENTDIYHFTCPKCGIDWQLLRLYKEDLPRGADEGYYLSLEGEDTMTWLGLPRANPNEIQTKARGIMASHSCFRKTISDGGGCGSILFILAIIWLVATVGGSGILAILGTIGNIFQIIWIAFLIAILLAIIALVVLVIKWFIGLFK